jgi:hypothetical protein
VSTWGTRARMFAGDRSCLRIVETAKDNAETRGAKTREKGKGKGAERVQIFSRRHAVRSAIRGDRAALICDLHSFLDLHKACLKKLCGGLDE